MDPEFESMARKVGTTAWLVTWEWASDHAKRDDKVAAILNPHWSSKHVREVLELLYINDKYSLKERTACARNKKNNPYPARLGTLEGVNWHGEIYCGHHPYLFARVVDNIQIECPEGSKEEITWDERPKPVVKC